MTAPSRRRVFPQTRISVLSYRRIAAHAPLALAIVALGGCASHGKRPPAIAYDAPAVAAVETPPAEANATIVERFANAVHTQGVRFEHDPVIDLDGENIAKRSLHRVGVRIAKPEQVEITRGTRRIIEPGGEKHGSLEDEPLGVT
jgi:hypothetical protein